MRFHLVLIMTIAALSAAAAQDEAAKKAPESVVAERRDFTEEATRRGTFVPTVFDEIEIWPEEYAGEWLFLEVLPHGTPVGDNDVIARFCPRSIDRHIEQAERAVRSAELALKNALARAVLAEKSAGESIEDARAGLENARRSLKGWEEYELEFAARNAELRQRYLESSIEDQEDELAQLEAMYRDDELTDATEEIVLKRARRNLALSIKSEKIRADQRGYAAGFTEPLQTDEKRRSVMARERALDHLVKTQEIESRTRKDGIDKAGLSLKDQREKLERLLRDRGLMTLRATRPGVLLHGSAEDYRPGRAAPRCRRGGRAATRKALFSVADPDRFEVAVDVPEPKLGSYRIGMAACVSSMAAPEPTLMGTLHVDRFPSPGSAAAGENAYEAAVRLESPVPGVAAGMRAGVKFVLQELHNVFVLPETAVFGRGKDAHCWMADPKSGEFKRVGLELGPSGGGEVVVYGDLVEKGRVLLCAP